MQRICLTLPTNRPCAPALRGLLAEAAYGAREFGVAVEVLVLDSAPAAIAAAHRDLLTARPTAPGVTVHHLDESAQRAVLARALARAGLPEQDRLLDLLLPDAVSYGACTDRAFLFAEALGCTSVHRRDSDSRYQLLDQEPVFPLGPELASLGHRAADVAARRGPGRLSRLGAGAGDRPVALVGASFIGELSVDVGEILDQDPAVHHDLIDLSLPPGTPAPWRAQAVRDAFRGAGTEAFTADRAALGPVAPGRVDMCNVAIHRDVYARVPLPPATDTIGTDYFLLHVLQHAALPGVQHNRHIVNFHTGERRTDAGRLAYHLRLAKFLLLSRRLGELHTRLAATRLLDADGHLLPAAVADAVRDAATPDDDGADRARLDTVEHAYRRLPAPWHPVADALAARRPELLARARTDLTDHAALIDAWHPLLEALREPDPPRSPAPPGARGQAAPIG